MIILLPSCGALGTKSVDLQPVRFEHIRNIHNINSDDNISKIDFLKMLLPQDFDFSTISYWDFIYLFNVSVFSVLYNSVKFTSTCSHCGHKFKNDFSIAGMDVKTILGYHDVTKTFDGTEYTFHLLSAQDYIDALEYSAPLENEQDAYNDFIVYRTLCLDTPNNASTVPASVYLYCFLYQNILFHGVKMAKDSICPKCGKPFETRLRIPLSLIKFEMNDLMNMYTSISDRVTFDDFNQMTLPEYNALVSVLNDLARKHGQS